MDFQTLDILQDLYNKNLISKEEYLYKEKKIKREGGLYDDEIEILQNESPSEHKIHSWGVQR